MGDGMSINNTTHGSPPYNLSNLDNNSKLNTALGSYNTKADIDGLVDEE
jgi:hypothetical protein